MAWNLYTMICVLYLYLVMGSPNKCALISSLFLCKCTMHVKVWGQVWIHKMRKPVRKPYVVLFFLIISLPLLSFLHSLSYFSSFFPLSLSLFREKACYIIIRMENDNIKEIIILKSLWSCFRLKLYTVIMEFCISG